MRFLVVLLAAWALVSIRPAWAYLETQPGTEEWPEIPDRAGMKAFQDLWLPQCNKGALQNAGDMTIHADGRISYERDEIWPTGYRVIEETPHYVVALVRAPTFELKTINVAFWALRPLGKSFRPRGHTDMSTMGVNYCLIRAEVARATEIWNFTDAELVEFWRTSKDCHPSKTKKIEGGSYWGEGWGQMCYYARGRR
jgi:hypothetical protein